jgi:hypothetical protein
MASYPTINGQYVSWAEMGISLEVYGGESYKTRDFAALDFDDSLTSEKVKGTGPEPIGRTVGEYEANGSMTMYYASARQFEAALASINPKIGLVPFDIVVSWSPLSGDGEVNTVKLVSCRLQGRQVSSAPGPAATQQVMALSVMRVEKDGICLV